ncbi:MAG TPA: M20/M25/M40 family metallo-hydrolase [Terriglobales bacterium]|nr:M20/M25/M40 family metallo-hydrolase [Terriglobales bacterium]
MHGNVPRVFVISLCLLAGMSLWAAGPAILDPPPPTEDGTMPALTAIAGHGMLDSHPVEDLQELSDDIGGRVTGSPQAAKAIEWGLAKMRAIGLSNVHTEKWQLSRGWTRVSGDAEVLSPIQRGLTIDSMGWVGSTPKGGVEGELVAVDVGHLDQEVKENSGKWPNKILLVIRKEKGEEPKREERRKAFLKFGPFLRAAYQAHALAVIGGQGGSTAAGMHLTHTGVLGFDTFYEIPVVSIIAEDHQQLERFLEAGKTVRLKMNVQNRITDGPVESANVVGEIRGTQHPEQVVVIGGHLDSWDLAQGTTDDGCGVATTLGAAEAIAKAGQRPKRTMRFVLFTGEEQGLLGSFAYVKMHQDEMANHVAAVILDNGQGPVVSLNLGGRDDLKPAVQKFAESVKSFGEIKVDDKTSFGTDSGPFTLAGLPGVNMGQDSPEYKYTHHSAVDTFDKVKPDLLTRDATLMALTAFWIADRPERLASPWPPEKTARALVKQKDDLMLKAFGLWPFGDLGKDARPDKESSESDSE